MANPGGGKLSGSTQTYGCTVALPPGHWPSDGTRLAQASQGTHAFSLSATPSSYSRVSGGHARTRLGAHAPTAGAAAKVPAGHGTHTRGSGSGRRYVPGGHCAGPSSSPPTAGAAHPRASSAYANSPGGQGRHAPPRVALV